MTTPECSGKTDPAVEPLPPLTSFPISAQANLYLRISPSRRLRLFIFCTHCLAAVIVWLSRLDLWLCLLGDLLILLSLSRTYRQHCCVGERLLRYSRLALESSEHRLNDEWQHGWFLSDAEAETRERPLSLCAPVLVWSWLIVLPFRDEAGQRFSLVLLADNTYADEVRRLRVLLRTGFPF